MGIFTFDRSGQIVAFEEKPTVARLAQMRSSVPEGSATITTSPDKRFIASMGIYLFSRRVLLDMLEQEAGNDFGRQLIPSALNRYRVSAYLYSGYWADVGTVDSFYEANVQLTRPDAPFSFYDPACPVYTHERFLPPSRLLRSELHNALVCEGTFIDQATVAESVVGIRTIIRRGATIRRSVLLGADTYETPGAEAHEVALGIGTNVELDRVIVDKNARIGDDVRLVNAGNAQNADADGYYIRNGIIVVSKGAVIPPGTVV